jgi:ribosomal protein L40E
MSSATSIKGDFPLKAEATRQAERTGRGSRGPEGTEPAAADSGFRPWHFFVLVSLAASTAAVLLSRRSSPEHLILLSITIGAAGLAAAALYRMLAPFALRDVSQLSAPPSERALAALEREKALVLRSIKELEFDRAMGKVSPKDFDEMAGRLRARAIMLMKQVDAGGSGYRELIERELQRRLKTRTSGEADRVATEVIPPAASPLAGPQRTAAIACAACGTNNDPDAAFCKRCGTALAVPQ